ncbi:hypothetical protein RDWZM_000671 [Blomia tropicalis]|uniref:Gamma-tubulin complex component n=1 Tax=Blomia tropicalis TaxID=40697 RepID=A0A9Q0RPW1_BLOTA|nr:hypothetical protein RDWZM_000671 [Blomia tropicalis]
MDENNDLAHNAMCHVPFKLVRKLCSTMVPYDHENFDKICRYSFDLITQKRIKIEDCEEQYILSKIRHSFMKHTKFNESSHFENLYLNLKTLSSAKSTVNIGDLLYCLFMLSNHNNSKQDIISVTNNVQKLKFHTPDTFGSTDYEHALRNINEKYGEINMRKNVNHVIRPHTIYGDTNHDYEITSKYSLLARDLICIFQGLPGKHISFNANEKFSFDIARSDIFEINDLFFAKRLSVLGQHFKSIKTYSNTTMSNSLKGFVCQSFGSALDEQINDFYKLMTNIQSNYHKRNNGDVTLHKLNIWTYETCVRFEALSNLIGKCRSKKGGALISVVYDFMRHGDPIVSESIRIILSKVVKPIRSMLNHWIFYGELKDEFKEFFICINENSHISSTMNNDFWLDKYSVNKTMLPGFISKEQAYKILIIGKAISMLREVSSNRLTIILPVYDQLKQSFENSNLETLFNKKSYDNSNDFASLLEYVYKEISQTALNILNDRYTLYGHFVAHKRYLLLEQGDFINYLMELFYPIINRPANKLKLYTLSQTLENAIRKTNAQYDCSEVLNRIDIFLEKSLPNENGWNIFALKYRIDGPISTIFNEQSQIIYSKIFMLFWKIKRVHFSLNHFWVDLKLASGKLSNLPKSFKCIFNHFNFTAYQILSFVNTIERYFNYLIESRWLHIKNELDHPRNLDRLIKAHQVFLQNVVKKIFFENSNDLTIQFNNISEHIFTFIDKLESFLNEIKSSSHEHIQNQWNDVQTEYEDEIDANYNFWLINFSKMFHKEILFFLELLVETEEDDLQELCFSIDFNKYYKCTVLANMNE